VTAAPRNTILTGDALTRLRELPGQSVDCVVTSPPYFQLRDYGVSGQLGLEPTVSGWVAELREVCREVARVLVPTGSLWLNVGDSFSQHPKFGAPVKGLLLAPERLLLALAQDGWLVRTKVIWAKTNPMPSSVTDRLSLTYEVIYFLVRQRSYFSTWTRSGSRTNRARQSGHARRSTMRRRGRGRWRLRGAGYGGRARVTGPDTHSVRTLVMSGRWLRAAFAARILRRSRRSWCDGQSWQRVRRWSARPAGRVERCGRERCNADAKHQPGAGWCWTRFLEPGQPGWWRRNWGATGWGSN
jgi:hypothetical protein